MPNVSLATLIREWSAWYGPHSFIAIKAETVFMVLWLFSKVLVTDIQHLFVCLFIRLYIQYWGDWSYQQNKYIPKFQSVSITSHSNDKCIDRCLTAAATRTTHLKKRNNLENRVCEFSLPKIIIFANWRHSWISRLGQLEGIERINTSIRFFH